MKADERDCIGKLIRMASEERSYGQRAGDALHIKGPAGFELWAQGRVVIMVTLVACAAVGLGYMLWQHVEESKVANSTIIAALQEIVYIQTLTEAEKKQLRLAMPTSMRGRLLEQERDVRRP